MDKKIAGLLGAAAALTTVTATHAAAPAPAAETTQVTSYRDLLDPIPNPVAALKADDARLADQPGSSGVKTAQYHHHHHHHHAVPRVIRRVLHPHHHHHHHH
jgi:hypothetical protein